MTDERALTADEFEELKVLAHREAFFQRKAYRERLQLTTCAGKVRFATWDLARDVRDRPAKKDLRRTIYRCHGCQGYHLGERYIPSQRLRDRRPRVEL